MSSKILVVDDLAPNRELIREALDDSEYEICEAATASDALERLQYRETDLVITDVRMPGMSGVELLKRLHRDYPRRCCSSDERIRQRLRCGRGDEVGSAPLFVTASGHRRAQVRHRRGALPPAVQRHWGPYAWIREHSRSLERTVDRYGSSDESRQDQFYSLDPG